MKKRERCALLVGQQFDTASTGNSTEVPQKINGTTIQHINSTSGYLSEENEHTSSKGYVHPYIHCSKQQ